MTEIRGLDRASPWVAVVRRPPTGILLNYFAGGWSLFCERYRSVGQPLTERNEAALTEALGTFLIDEASAGRQPFDGDFYAELRHCSLNRDGTIKVTDRTDLEWRLSGFTAFVVEFKILGPGRRTQLYLSEGMRRFVDGRYAPTATEGAMCGLVRPWSLGRDPIEELERLIDNDAATYRCVVNEEASTRHAPSMLAPHAARFDTLHERDAPKPIVRLAHFFIEIPGPLDVN